MIYESFSFLYLYLYYKKTSITPLSHNSFNIKTDVIFAWEFIIKDSFIFIMHSVASSLFINQTILIITITVGLKAKQNGCLHISLGKHPY